MAILTEKLDLVASLAPVPLFALSLERQCHLCQVQLVLMRSLKPQQRAPVEAPVGAQIPAQERPPTLQQTDLHHPYPVRLPLAARRDPR